MNSIEACLNCTADRCDPYQCRLRGNLPYQERDRRTWEWHKHDAEITVNGETHTIRELAEISGIAYMTIYMRILRGWSHEDAIFKPLMRKGQKYEKKGKGTDEHSE